MKFGYVQAFDKKEDALKALGRIEKIFPAYDNRLVDNCHQVQFWKTADGKTTTDIMGKPDDEIVFLVISTPKPA